MNVIKTRTYTLNEMMEEVIATARKKVAVSDLM